jgi:hypothetical protein
MRKLGVLVAVLLGALICAGADGKPGAKGPAEDGTLPELARVAGEGMMNSHAYDYLTELSDEVGARVTGTPGAQKGIEWATAKMKAVGLENVHTEKWTMWRGWTRGSAEAELLAPVRRKLTVDAMGWTGSTVAGGAEGEVVRVNTFALDEEMKNAAQWAGKVLLAVQQGPRPKEGDSLFARFGDFLKAAQKA